MKITTASLRRSSKKTPHATLFQLPNQSISYQQGWSLVSSHKQYLQSCLDKIESTILSPHPFSDDSSSHTSPTIIISYLSGNSPDLLLSLFASIELQHNHYDILPAMLNIRWTSTEIVKALREHNISNECEQNRDNGNSHESNKLSSVTFRRNHITIFIYDSTVKEYENIAKQVENDLSSNTHQVFIMPLPTYIHQPIHIQNLHEETPSNENDKNLDLRSNIHDTAIILFTSGTTSSSKGVLLSHMSLFIQAMAKTIYPCNYDSNTAMLASDTVPFFHVGGISSVLAVIMSQGSLIFSKTFYSENNIVKSNITSSFQKVQQFVNTLIVVPAMLHSFYQDYEHNNKCNGGEFMNSQYNNVRLIVVGGQNLTSLALKQTIFLFPNASIIQTFACTEAGSSLTFAPLYNPSNQNHHEQYENNKDRGIVNSSSNKEFQNENTISKHQRHVGYYCGLPPPHIQIEIIDDTEIPITHETTGIVTTLPSNVKILSPFIVGKIATRGPHCMSGYWTRENKSNISMKANNHYSYPWVITNDLGYLDDRGGLYFCSRLKDVIRTGGESVFAPEVEDVLLQHPDIESCAVFGLPHPRFGECVTAAIVWKKSSLVNDEYQKGVEPIYLLNEASKKYLRDYCEEKGLSRYKAPIFIFVSDDLPRNSSGKLMKHELVKMCETFNSSHYINSKSKL